VTLFKSFKFVPPAKTSVHRRFHHARSVPYNHDNLFQCIFNGTLAKYAMIF